MLPRRCFYEGGRHAGKSVALTEIEQIWLPEMAELPPGGSEVLAVKVEHLYPVVPFRRNTRPVEEELATDEEIRTTKVVK